MGRHRFCDVVIGDIGFCDTGIAVKIINFPHPTLRHKSKPIRRVDAELRKWIEQMFELMYEAKGVGLAANQVDLPFRLFVANPKAEPDPESEFVFINPVISKPKGNEEAEEGCLSMPGLYGAVKRPATIHVQGYSLKGEEFNMDLDGLFARIVQHETDHLDGIVFTDRMSDTGKLDVQPGLDEFTQQFEGQINRGELPPVDEIKARLSDLEKKYC